MSRPSSTRRLRAPGMVFVAISLVAGCSDDDALSIDEAAAVDDGAAPVATGAAGIADVSFDRVTASVTGVTCSIAEDAVVVSPIVSDSFTLTVDGDPASNTWNVEVTKPGDPAVVWTAADPTVGIDGDAVAGSAEMHRTDDATVTAALAFVVDC